MAVLDAGCWTLDARCWVRKWTLVESRARAMVMVGDGTSGRAAHWDGYVKKYGIG